MNESELTCLLWIPKKQAWYKLGESTDWKKTFEKNIWRLKFMMCCDVGWTGIGFDGPEGTKIRIFYSLDHIVDITGQELG